MSVAQDYSRKILTGIESIDTTPLWIISLLVISGDITTTYLGISSMCFREGNPVIRMVLENSGFFGFAILKSLILILPYAAERLSSKKYGVAILFGLILPHTYAVAHNSTLLLNGCF